MEEVLCGSLMRAFIRICYFISRFMLVIVVALSIESLVAVFHYTRENPQYLPNAAAIGLTAAALLVTWGIFVKQNTAAEHLEPETVEATKEQEKTLEEGSEDLVEEEQLGE